MITEWHFYIQTVISANVALQVSDKISNQIPAQIGILSVLFSECDHIHRWSLQYSNHLVYDLLVGL